MHSTDKSRDNKGLSLQPLRSIWMAAWESSLEKSLIFSARHFWECNKSGKPGLFWETGIYVYTTRGPNKKESTNVLA